MTQNELQYHIFYDSISGIFKWNNTSKHSNNNTGDIAGSYHKQSGYIKIKISGKSYQAHRLAWLYEKGFMPNKIDHINRDKSDNRICNLRDVGYVENNRNASIREDNNSGASGVSWQSSNSRWKVKIGSKYIGVFKDKNDAISARKKAEAELGYLN